MAPLKFRNRSEQLADYLRTEILRGAWRSEMPGAPKLGADLQVDHKTIIAALQLLESEGLLVSQGAGRRRKIVLPGDYVPPSHRVQILPYEKEDLKRFYMVELQHQLQEAGHASGFASKTLCQLGMDLKRIARFVQQTDADAWVVISGSREVLEWFAAQPTPTFAFAGRRRGIAMAGGGPDKAPALRDAIAQLTALGHRRIVTLVREERRKPTPGFLERAFLDALQAHGIPTGPYNLPDWEDTPAGFHACIDSLFQHTPPTALLIDEMPLFMAAQQHLARRGFLAPRDVSLICLDPDPAFAWFETPVAHIRWDPRPLVRQVVEWASKVASGREGGGQSFTKAEFVIGGTVGPATNR